MKLLLDENVPATFAKLLTGHDCSSVIRLGWRGTKNGALLIRAEQNGFDVLVTLDDDIEREQSMRNKQIAVLVLRPNGQGKKVLSDLAPTVLEALREIRPGQIKSVRSPQGQ